MSNTETYGDFRVEFLHDEKGEKLWSDSLFFNFTTFGTSVKMDFYFELIKQKICY